MHHTTALIIVGICGALGGCAFLVVNELKARRTGEQSFHQRAARLEWYMSFVWSGMFLVQLSSILLHWEAGAIFHVSPVTWAAAAGSIFICGLFTGRLLLRREMHLHREQRDERGGA